MTEHDLDLWRLNARITLLELLAAALLQKLAQTSEAPDEILLGWEKTIRDSAAGVAFNTGSPGQSDMLAAEAQDCIDHFLALLRPPK